MNTRSPASAKLPMSTTPTSLLRRNAITRHNANKYNNYSSSDSSTNTHSTLTAPVPIVLSDLTLVPLQHHHHQQQLSSPVTSHSPSTDISTSSSSTETPPLFERHLVDRRRRQEIAVYVRGALSLINSGVYKYQRLEGLRQMEQLLAQLLYDWKSLPDDNISSSSNRYGQLQREQLEKDARIFDDLHAVTSREQNAVSAIVSSFVRRREVARVELLRALIVLEGCCLLSPMCSVTLFSEQGVKQLVRIASDTAVMRRGDPQHSADGGGDDDSREQIADVEDDDDVEEWEEVRMLAIDVLEACVHNSVHNVLYFCEEHGVDPIVAMIRDASLSLVLRSKSVEFVALLLHIVRQSLRYDHKGHITDKTLKSLCNKLEEYLGRRLASEILKLELKTVPSRKRLGQDILDLHSSTFDSFIALVDNQF